MAPKRKQKRIPRRVNVRFKRQGDKEFAVGYTKNISVGGLFIGTIRPLPPGTEIVVEIKEDERTRRRPAMVVHAARVSALLATVRTSGMGVRFLDMEEADKAVAERGRKETEPPPEPAKQDERLAEQMTGPSDLEVDLSDIERFRDAFRRDIQHGLIFVPGPLALEAGEEVEWELPSRDELHLVRRNPPKPSTRRRAATAWCWLDLPAATRWCRSSTTASTTCGSTTVMPIG